MAFPGKTASGPQSTLSRELAAREGAHERGLETGLPPKAPNIAAARHRFAALRGMVPPAPNADYGPRIPDVTAARRQFAGYWSYAAIRFGFLALCVGSIIGVAALYVLSLTNNLSVEGDNAVYIILAKSLATGHGYTDIQTLVPRNETMYPPLFPLVLAPVVRIFGTDGVRQMEAVVGAFALGSLAMTLCLFRRWLGSALLALAIAVVTGASDLLWSFSHKVLTEVPYLFFTLLACWWATTYAEEDRWWTRAGLLAALAAGAAFLTRTIGLSICVALPVYLLLARAPGPWAGNWRLRLQKAVFTFLPIAAIVGSWTIRNRLVYTGQGHNYIAQFYLKQTYVPDAGRIAISQLLDRAAHNVSYYAAVYQRMLAGHVWDRVPTHGDLSQGLLAITFVGFVYALIRRRTLAEFYMVAYVAIVLLWPWQDLRFAVPVLPFLIYYLAQALILPLLVLARWRPIDARVAAAMVLIPLAMPTGDHTVRAAIADQKAGYHYEVERLGEWPSYPDWRDFHAAAMWLKQHAAAGATVINRSPNIFYSWTGLYSRNYPYSFNRRYMMNDISHEHNDYVIYDDFGKWTYTTALYLRPVLRHYPQRFTIVYRIHNTSVYRVVPQPKHTARRVATRRRRILVAASRMARQSDTI